MANYTGDPTATEAPSAPPTPGVAPIVDLPADGDPTNAATFVQGYKVAVDFIAWLMKPRATLGSWTEEITAFRNARLQRRGGYDHMGHRGGQLHEWDEDWTDTVLAPKTAVSSGAWGRQWNFQLGCTPGALAGGGISTSGPNFSGPHIVGPRSAIVTLNPFPTAASTAWCLIESALGFVPIDDNSSIALQWQGMPGGSSAFVGFSSPLITLSTQLPFTYGAALGFRVGDTTWHVMTNTGGGASVFTDTGISTGTGSRFRLEYVGANTSDDSIARVNAYVDGVRTTVAVTLGEGVTGVFLRGWNATNVTSPGSIGIVKYRSSLVAGDVFI